jgi:hypothetical protein
MESVLFHRGHFSELIAPMLDLRMLWCFYQTCTFFRDLLCDWPDIAVYREARLNYHGVLTEPLLAALKREGNVIKGQLWRCMMAVEPRDWRIFRRVTTTLNPYELRFPTNPAAFTDDTWTTRARRVLQRGDLHTYCEWALRVGFDYLRQTNHTKMHLISAAIQGGLPELAIAMGFCKPEIILENGRILWFIRNATYSKHNTRSLEYAAREWPQDLAEYVQSQEFTNEVHSLKSVKWIFSYVRIMQFEMNYEHIYRCYMEHLPWDAYDGHYCISVLEWIKPLAVTQFKQRLAINATAVPYIPRIGDYTRICRHLGLLVWPDIKDHRHYAFEIAPPPKEEPIQHVLIGHFLQ